MGIIMRRREIPTDLQGNPTDLGNLEVGSDGIRVDSSLASILNQKGMAVSTDGASGGRRKLTWLTSAVGKTWANLYGD